MTCLPRSFYARPPKDVARDLIGHILVKIIETDDMPLTLSGTIVETEAYGYRDDEASHAFRGKTARNSVMFGQVGIAYIYLSYGIHYCLNVSARDSECEAGAVLLRAILPAEGLNVTQSSVKKNNLFGVLSGPGKLTKALNVSLMDNGTDMTSESSRLRIEKGSSPLRAIPIVATKRIGISKNINKEWRFVYSSDQGGPRLVSSPPPKGSLGKRGQTF